MKSTQESAIGLALSLVCITALVAPTLDRTGLAIAASIAVVAALTVARWQIA